MHITTSITKLQGIHQEKAFYTWDTPGWTWCFPGYQSYPEHPRMLPKQSKQSKNYLEWFGCFGKHPDFLDCFDCFGKHSGMRGLYCALGPHIPGRFQVESTWNVG